MNALTEFQAQAANAALNKMFRRGHFDICTFDALAKSIGAHCGGPDYDALRNLHCVDWADMPPALRETVKEKVVEMLGVGPVTFEMREPEVKQPEPEPERRTAAPKLAFWKR